MTDLDPSAIRRAVAERIMSRAPELGQVLAGRMLAAVQESGELDARVQRLVAQLARDILVESMAAMPALTPGPQRRTVSASLLVARRLAEAGVSAHSTNQLFHVAHAWWLDLVLTELWAVQPSGLAMELVAPLMKWQLRGFLGLADAAAQEHAAVLDSWRASAGSALSTRVAFVLSDVEDAAEANQVLGFDVSRRNLGLVIWSSCGTVPTARLMTLADGLGAGHGVVNTLIVPRDISSLYAWVSLSGSPRQTLALIQRRATSLADVRLAVGEPLAGLQGFKTTHAQALLARRMAQLPGSRNWRSILFRDVAAAQFLTSHPEDAEPWATAVLGDLAGPGEDNERLRGTLRVYLESGENATRAAERLYVHRNTVKYRVARALELLGVPLDTHRLNVALALNYYHCALASDTNATSTAL